METTHVYQNEIEEIIIAKHTTKYVVAKHVEMKEIHLLGTSFFERSQKY